MTGTVFYTGVFGFGLGVFVQSMYALPGEAALLLLLTAFALGVLWRRRAGDTPPPDALFFYTGIFLLCVALGLLRIEVTMWRESALTPLENTEVTGEGVVAREPDVRAATQHLYVREIQSHELLLVTTDRHVPVEYGDIVRFTGVVERPESFVTDLGRTFNYSGYLRARGVTHAVFFADVEVSGRGAGNRFFAFLLSWKHRFMDAFERAVPEPAAGLGEGLLLGAKRALGDDLEDVFRRVGIIHIVVLSGYNIMIVARWVMAALSYFFLPRTRIVIGIMALSCFALLVGLSATVVRASIMAVLALVAQATGRVNATLRALTLAGLAMVFINPYLLAFDPGFQLSFLATLGLIMLAPHVERAVPFVPTFWGAREYVTATVSTQIMVLPLILYLMGTFSVVAVAANVLVLPMVPVGMGLTFVVGTTGLILPGLALAFGILAHVSLEYIIVVAALLASLPWSSFIVPAFPFPLVVAGYALLAYWIWRLYKRAEERIDIEPTYNSKELKEYNNWTIISLEDFKREMETVEVSARVDSSVKTSTRPIPALSEDIEKERGTPVDEFPFR